MSKIRYVRRIPRTAEEKEYDRKRNKFIRVVLGSNFLFLVFVLIFVPKEPNTAFYCSLNEFLDTYLLGNIFPDFSDNFYFSMKVAWCLSFLLYLEFMLVLAIFMYACLGNKGIRAIIYLSKYDSQKIYLSFNIITLIATIRFSIYSYAFDSTQVLTVYKGFDAIFYGHYVRSCLLFLLCKPIDFMIIYISFFRCYYLFFCQEKVNK